MEGIFISPVRHRRVVSQLVHYCVCVCVEGGIGTVSITTVGTVAVGANSMGASVEDTIPVSLAAMGATGTGGRLAVTLATLPACASKCVRM